MNTHSITSLCMITQVLNFSYDEFSENASLEIKFEFIVASRTWTLYLSKNWQQKSWNLSLKKFVLFRIFYVYLHYDIYPHTANNPLLKWIIRI